MAIKGAILGDILGSQYEFGVNFQRKVPSMSNSSIVR